MTKQAKRALEASIWHWWENYYAATANQELKIGPASCALCRCYSPELRRMWRDEPCKGCPVKNRTGRPYCYGSPYQKVRRGSITLINSVTEERGSITLINSVTEEIEFLESLRDYPHKGW